MSEIEESWLEPEPRVTCPECDGTKEIAIDETDGSVTRRCSVCRGEGTVTKRAAESALRWRGPRDGSPRVICITEICPRIMSVRLREVINPESGYEQLHIIGATASAPGADLVGEAKVDLMFQIREGASNSVFSAPLVAMLRHDKTLREFAQCLPVRELADSVRALARRVEQLSNEKLSSEEAIAPYWREPLLTTVVDLTTAWSDLYQAAQPHGEAGSFYSAGCSIVRGLSRCYFEVSGSAADVAAARAADPVFEVVALSSRAVS